MAPQQGEWVLLSQALPDSYALKLLGRVVATCTNPHHNYVPPTEAVIPTPAQIQVEDESANICFDATRKTEVRARLTTLFHAEGTNTATSSHIIANTTIITRLLDQHNTHFQGLKKMYGPEIEKLIDDKHRGKGDDARTAYLVVGTKTCLNATMGSFDTSEATRSGGFQIPVQDIVTTTIGIPLALPVSNQPNAGSGAKPLDVTLDANDQRTVNTFRSGTAKGERLFAVQCIRIRTHRGWKFWSKPELESSGIQDGVLGGDDSDDDSQDSDGESVGDPIIMADDSTPADDTELELEPGSDTRTKGVFFVFME
ncbi:hypothetical protein VTL71DRAFT_9232 [Oculimacula yallundae]|uniref:Uncharacterized protein n=1 Tax=Oculimacula yallundae TaxID=86028 RepID=A0ABR4BTQ3_9HELO